MITRKDLETRLNGILTATITGEKKSQLHRFYSLKGDLYRYSFMNNMLIQAQGGTFCQNYNNWKKAGRYVKAGEKARISVLRPWIKKEEVKKVDPVTGEEKTELSEGAILGYFDALVFDISQTDGKPLEYQRNSEDSEAARYEEIKAAALEAWPELKIRELFTGTARGWVDGNGEITISSASNNADKIKTLLHEIAHHLLDHTKSSEARGQKETEAEATAYLAALAIGFNPDLSDAYIDAWQAGQEDNVNTLRIMGTTERILKGLKIAI